MVVLSQGKQKNNRGKLQVNYDTKNINNSVVCNWRIIGVVAGESVVDGFVVGYSEVDGIVARGNYNYHLNNEWKNV